MPTRQRPRAWRVALILLAGGAALFWVWFDNRWGVEAPMERWDELEVHDFGNGSGAVVLLHGYGSSPDSLVPFARELARRVPGRYLLPRGPKRVSRGGYAWFRWPGEAGSERAHVQDVLRTRRSLAQVVSRARREGAETVVVMGHSMGGRMAMDLGLSLDPPPAAIGLLAGSSLPTWRSERVEGQRVFMAAGARDPVFPIAEERRLRDQLVELGAELTWFTHPGGHEVGPIADDLAAYLAQVLERSD